MKSRDNARIESMIECSVTANQPLGSSVTERLPSESTLTG